MRQKQAFIVIVLMTLVILGGLTVYGFIRAGGRPEGLAGGHEHGEQAEPVHAEKAESHEHAPAAGEPADQPELEPSGSLRGGVRMVEVRAHRFEFVPSTIVVRAGEKVRLEITSEDVTHGFGLPEMGVSKVLKPNEPVTAEFSPQEAGEHEFRCTVYCGEGHGRMKGKLVVLPAADEGAREAADEGQGHEEAEEHAH